VEFALVLPILLVLALAVVQVGLIARDQLVLAQASRAGAREAAVTVDDAAVRAAVLEAGPGLDPGRLDVSVARGGSRGDPVTVSVTLTEPIRVPFVEWLFPPSVTLRGQAVMRQEFG